MRLVANIGSSFIPPWSELRPFTAELWLIATIVAVLVTPFFAKRINLTCALVTLCGLCLAIVSVAIVGVSDITGEHLRGLLVADAFAVFWKVLLLLFVIGVVLMQLGTTFWSMREGDGPEFYTLLLGATLGMALMGSTTNLLMIFIAVEIASLPSYVLAGFRKTHRLGAEASLKYVIFGAATSSIMVYGLSLLYGLYGTLQISTAAQQMLHATTAGGGALLTVGVFGVVVGLGFKIAAVPFHFWCPDVFEGAGVEVTNFLSVASKGAGLVMLLRVLMTIADAVGYQNSAHISLGGIAAVIGVMGALTATIGNVAAFTQQNIKRLLAYSSIAHAGYILCALSLLVNHGGNTVTHDGANGPAQVVLVYLAVYLFMNLGAFTVAGLVWRQTGSEDISGYAGLGRRAPLLAAAMFCCMVSLIGLPPFAGFAAKLYLLLTLIQNGGWWWWLVAIIAVNTVLSAFYYFRVIREMYLRDSEGAAPFSGHPLGVAVAVCSAVMLVVMLLGYNSVASITARFSHLAGVEGTPEKSPLVSADH